MSAVPPQLPPKPDVALALLQTATSVFVHLDPRGTDVLVPAWFKKQPQLVLQIGLNMTVPIPDLDVGKEGITCTLSFNRSPQFCRLPWAAIYGLVGEDGRGMIWPDSVPKEVAASADGRAQATQAEKARRGKLRLASSEGLASSEDGATGHLATERLAAEGSSAKSTSGQPAAAAKGPGRKGRRKGEGRPGSKKAAGISAGTSVDAVAIEAGTEEVRVEGAPREAVGRPKERRSDAQAGSAEAGLASKGPDPAKTPAARQPAGSAGQESPASPGKGPEGPSGKARRELPPYLRIVK